MGLKERHHIHAAAFVWAMVREHVPLTASIHEVMVEDAEFLVRGQLGFTRWETRADRFNTGERGHQFDALTLTLYVRGMVQLW
jgi:hypothetical protein